MEMDSGDTTYLRLKNWMGDQKSSERLAGQVLKHEGFSSIDPSHPLALIMPAWR